MSDVFDTIRAAMGTILRGIPLKNVMLTSSADAVAAVTALTSLGAVAGQLGQREA